MNDMEQSEKIPIRLGGYAHSERPISVGSKRDKLVLMGSIVLAHLVIVAVLVAVTRSSSGPTERRMIEMVEYWDIAVEHPDGTLEAPTEEAKQAGIDQAAPAPTPPAP